MINGRILRKLRDHISSRVYPVCITFLLSEGVVIIYGRGGGWDWENRLDPQHLPLNNRALRFCPPPSEPVH